MFVAIYDSTGRLKSVEMEELTINADGIDTFNVTIPTSILEDGDYAKVFLWGVNYIPVREAFVFD
jgi:hypothetical protein